MTDILLALCVGLAFALGCLPMKRLDRFLERNREAIAKRGRDGWKDAPGKAGGEGARRARDSGGGLSRAGSWRGGNLSPLRHRV